MYKVGYDLNKNNIHDKDDISFDLSVSVLYGRVAGVLSYTNLPIEQ